MTQKLTHSNHDRDVAGLKYIYPVISRRAGGLSIGINFNPNNACNWRCLYCQVPDLKKGTAPEMNFDLLEFELKTFLDNVLYGNFYQRFNVPQSQQCIKDIAISGNGEPTSLKNFSKAIEIIAKIATQAKIFPKANFVLISNGSLMHRHDVQAGLKMLNQYQGEVWFKIDSVTKAGLTLINNTNLSPEKQFSALITSTNLCNTKLQTCLINYRQQGFLDSEKHAYLGFLQKLKATSSLKEIMLYSLARHSFQPEAMDIEKMSSKLIKNLADEIKMLGFKVSISN